MKLNLNSINYYFLTCCNDNRIKHIINEFKTYNLIQVNPVMNIGKFRSTATGFSKILDMASVTQDKNKPFQPFVIFEDDVKKNREFPSTIDIPDNTDILYIGLSDFGFNSKKQTHDFNVYFKNINKNLVKVYNMLSMHGIIICSLRGMLSLQKCLVEDFCKNRATDISISQLQPYLNIYALKNPLVYQYGKIGGIEYQTKIDLLDKDDNIMPDNDKNKDSFSIISLYTENNLSGINVYTKNYF